MSAASTNDGGSTVCHTVLCDIKETRWMTGLVRYHWSLGQCKCALRRVHLSCLAVFMYRYSASVSMHAANPATAKQLTCQLQPTNTSSMEHSNYGTTP